jgi:hypothetical protein
MSRLISRLSPVTYVVDPDTVGRAKATFVGNATASPCAYADGVSLIDTMVLPVTVIRS